MKTTLLICILTLLGTTTNDTYTLDLKCFTIEVPKNWRYIQQQGMDSFVGEIKGPGVKLSFDCSHMGYANSLVQDADEYISERITAIYSNYFNEPDVIYTNAENVDAVKKDEMEKINTTDSSLIKVRPYIRPLTRIYKPAQEDLNKYEDADYLVDLTYNDSTITVGVTLPDDIKKHNVQIDTVDQYVIKTIWPKKVGGGTTGVYYRKLGSQFNLQINGKNLGERQQADVLKAFRTIRISKN